MRRLIVQTFEAVCIALVILPTALGILWVFFVETRAQDIAILATVGVFIFTSFLAGGALTLVEIAHNTKGCMEALRDMRLTGDAPRTSEAPRMSETPRTSEASRMSEAPRQSNARMWQSNALILALVFAIIVGVVILVRWLVPG